MPSLLSERTHHVREGTVPWEGYQQTGLITYPHLELIQKYDKKADHERVGILAHEGKQYAELFLKLSESLTATDTTQYVLTLVSDMLSLDEANKQYFLECANENPAHPTTPFINLLKSDDAYIAYKSLDILTVLLSSPNTTTSRGASGPTTHEESVDRLMAWVTQQLSIVSNPYVENVVLALNGILRVDSYRSIFYKKVGAVHGLMGILSRKPSYQMQYEIAFTVWLLTFTKNIARTIQDDYKLVGPLVRLMQTETPKKIVRVVIAALRNLLKYDSTRRTNVEALVTCKAQVAIKAQENRKFDDDDLKDDIEFLLERLEVAVEDMTTYALYVAELTSGTLEWGPTHTSAAFWSENGSKLNNNNYQHLRLILRLIETSQDATTLAIAAHDLGEYVRVCPRGKNVIDQLDGKISLMNLLKSSDERVQQEALVASQKLMLNNWRSLQEVPQ